MCLGSGVINAGQVPAWQQLRPLVSGAERKHTLTQRLIQISRHVTAGNRTKIRQRTKERMSGKKEIEKYLLLLQDWDGIAVHARKLCYCSDLCVCVCECEREMQSHKPTCMTRDYVLNVCVLDYTVTTFVTALRFNLSRAQILSRPRRSFQVNGHDTLKCFCYVIYKDPLPDTHTHWLLKISSLVEDDPQHPFIEARFNL